jgi:hypothetical protein
MGRVYLLLVLRVCGMIFRLLRGGRRRHCLPRGGLLTRRRPQVDVQLGSFPEDGGVTKQLKRVRARLVLESEALSDHIIDLKFDTRRIQSDMEHL